MATGSKGRGKWPGRSCPRSGGRQGSGDASRAASAVGLSRTARAARTTWALIVFLLTMTMIPAAAAAKPVPPRYRMVYTGAGTYAVDLVSPDGLQGHVAADFHWRIAYRAAPPRDGIIEWDRGAADGSGSWSMSSEADRCSRSGQLQLTGDGGGLLDLQHGALEM